MALSASLFSIIIYLLSCTVLGVASLPFTGIIDGRRHTCPATRFYRRFLTDSQFGGSSADDTDTSGGEDETDMQEEATVSSLLATPPPSQLQVCRFLAPMG